MTAPPILAEGLRRSFGDIDAVDADVLRKQLDNGLMPVVSPLSCDESGTILNINADTVASAIGSAFVIAFQIPNLFRRLLGEGALTAAIVPVLADKSVKDGKLASFGFLNFVLRWTLLLRRFCLFCMFFYTDQESVDAVFVLA